MWLFDFPATPAAAVLAARRNRISLFFQLNTNYMVSSTSAVGLLFDICLALRIAGSITAQHAQAQSVQGVEIRLRIDEHLVVLVKVAFFKHDQGGRFGHAE